MADYPELGPLKEPEFDETPHIIFGVIAFPIIALFLGITCYCRAQRSKRKTAEAEMQRHAVAAEKPRQGDRLESENYLKQTELGADHDAGSDQVMEFGWESPLGRVR